MNTQAPIAHLAFVFPGQGSQSVGMLAELATEFPEVRKTFDEASEGAGFDLWSLAQNGPEAELGKTENTQPVLLAASVAVWKTWRTQGGPLPAQMAGHSLGEYSALVCAGALPLRDASKCWISSTLASEAVSLAAAGAVLEWHAQAEVCEGVWAAGEEIMQAVSRAIDASGIGGVSVRGIAPMWLLDFEDEDQRTRFGELAVEQGVLFKRGAYNFASLAHEEAEVAEIERAASEAFVALREELADA